MALVRELFPEFPDYLAVYEAAGLVTDRSVFAHGVYLSDSELARVSAARSTIAHCPTSNLFLGSGLYDLQRANRWGVQTSVGTDVGGGTSFSLLRTLDEMYKTQQLQGFPVNAFEMLYRCTLGAARYLHLAGTIGSFDIGNEADFVVIDYLAQDIQRTRMEYLRSAGDWTTESMLFGLEITGDDRNIAATYVMGRPVYTSRLQRSRQTEPRVGRVG
ncbi:amidohydrolase family protein [Micromonospora sp. WMMA1363]|uniref:amidohydrolase family protein n=1 Tax=Micromonospora sp. WMMA1363 TaxID=3053985 RepID=UPI00259CDECF|nr:amidohydrolase family protein [Micromonospora sp. WMMA1363]MDM4719582.1 amidohydrolase family protein [Micromonospora sp. WMMA1363]